MFFQASREERSRKMRMKEASSSSISMVKLISPAADEAVTFLMCLTYILPLRRRTPFEGEPEGMESRDALERSRPRPRFFSSTTQMIASLKR